MPKFKYSWPFLFAIGGNIIIWEEIVWQGVFRLAEEMDLLFHPDVFVLLFGGLIAFSMFGITVYQLWLNRFSKDQRWLMVPWGAVFFVGALVVFNETFGIPAPGALLRAFGLWCIPLLILYIIRQRSKPRYLKSKFTIPKNIVVVSVLGVGVILAILDMIYFKLFQFINIRSNRLIFAYMIFLQFMLPISLLLNLLDHHAREKGRGLGRPEELLIEEMGKE